MGLPASDSIQPPRKERVSMRLNVKKYRELMNEQGITQEDIARRTGLDHLSTIEWILQHGQIEISTIELLANIMNVSAGAISLQDFNNAENAIEWIRGNNTATVSFTQGRMISRIKKLAGSRPGECQIIAENQDGSISARVPTNWIRINPTMQLSKEQKEERTQRIKKAAAERHTMKYS